MRFLVTVLGVSMIMLAACVNVKFPTPTPRPTRTPTEIAAVPTDSAVTPDATEAVQGDIAEGDKLFHTFQPAAGMACTTCHRTDSDDRLVGPGLRTISTRAQTRVAGQNADEYIRNSIVDPSAYVVDGFIDMMPKNWGRVFTEAQLNDLVAYLMSLSQ